MSTIFGPVHSRRFGVSLGIDLSASAKQCNFDCLYCELAPMQAITQQHDTTPVEVIIADLTHALAQHPNIDVITLTANGEPTMYPYLDELVQQIDAIKEDKETLILSNSACLNDEHVFQTLLKLDQVKLSLDAATSDVFRKIDRPAEGIEISTIIHTIEKFSHVYTGKLFIEILFVLGLNDTLEEVTALNEALMKIKSNRIDIGTVDRPPAYAVEGLNFEELYALSQHFDPSLPIHIVSRKHADATATSYTNEEIISTLDKRPLTQEDIDALFDTESKIRLQEFINEGIITHIERSNVLFYLPTHNIDRKKDKSSKNT